MSKSELYFCKYCGKRRASLGGKRSHENSCPEVRNFVDFVVEKTKLQTEHEAKVTINIRTTNERVVNLVKNVKIFSKPFEP